MQRTLPITATIIPTGHGNSGVVPPWLRVGPDDPVIFAPDAPTVCVPPDSGFMHFTSTLDVLADIA